MSNLLDILSALILLTAFLLVASKKITSYIKLFRFQSLIISLGALMVGWNSFLGEGHIDIIIITVIMIALKVIYIPRTLNKLYEDIEHIIEKDFFANIPILVMGCIVLVVAVYFGLENIAGINQGSTYLRIVGLISVVLIGIIFMISRKKAIGEIVGYLVIENGIFSIALFTVGGVPLIVDLGIFVDLLTGVIIMKFMVYRINEQFFSTNINKLTNLKG